MTDTIFADGVSISSVETKYGEIIKLGIKIEPFMDFLAKHVNEKGYVNLDLKTSKNGDKKYLALNTYKKDDTTSKEISDEPVIEFDDMDEVPF